MEPKTLLEVDARVARLRDLVAVGKSSPEMLREIDQLIDQRMALIYTRAAQRPDIRPSRIISETVAAKPSVQC